MRTRKVVYLGGTYYISLYKQDIKDFDLEKWSLVDIDDIVKTSDPVNEE